MSGEFKENIQNPILKGLNSDDSEKVIETIIDLRVSGNSSHIPILLELLRLSPNSEIKLKITELLSNLKDSDAIPLIISAIEDKKYITELKELVSACWQNGLDYSNYLAIFTKLLVENDFLVAFEAYTVIMNMTSKIEQSVIDVEIDRLDKALETISAEKRELLLDVIDLMPTIGF